jgi:hypothetical protein
MQFFLRIRFKIWCISKRDKICHNFVKVWIILQRYFLMHCYFRGLIACLWIFGWRWIGNYDLNKMIFVSCPSYGCKTCSWGCRFLNTRCLTEVRTERAWDRYWKYLLANNIYLLLHLNIRLPIIYIRNCHWFCSLSCRTTLYRAV